MIHNLPDYARERDFIVYRTVNGEKWFWGAYDDIDEAIAAADFCGGVIC